MKYFFILLVLFSIGLVSAEVTYELNWNEDHIVNGEEFEILVDVEGKDDTLYDGKLWIENNDKIITDRYDSKKDEWRSSYYYINEYFEDGVNKVRLIIDNEFSDFEGKTFIHFRLRGKEEIKETIEILGKKVKKEVKERSVKEESIIEEPIEEILEESQEIVLESISLGKKVATVEEKDINTELVVYQSKGTKIISYSVYGFAILCVLLCVLIIWRKLE